MEMNRLTCALMLRYHNKVVIDANQSCYNATSTVLPPGLCTLKWLKSGHQLFHSKSETVCGTWRPSVRIKI